MSFEDNFRHVGGMQPAVGSEFVPFSSEEIKRIEAEYGCALPDQLRELLTTFGGIACRESVGFDPVVPLPARLSSTGKGAFSHFFVSDDSDHSSTNWLSDNIEVYRDRMPEELLPIGSDGGGDLICMGISGSYRGKVYYWDHEHEWDEEDYLDVGAPVPESLKFQNVYLISNSLEEFVARLFVSI